MALCVPQTTETAPMGGAAMPPVPTVIGKSSSGDPKKADNLLAKLKEMGAKPVAAPVEAVKPLRIRIPPPSKEEREIEAAERKNARAKRAEHFLKFQPPLTTIKEVNAELTRLLKEQRKFEQQLEEGTDATFAEAALRVVTITIGGLRKQLREMEKKELETQVMDLSTQPKEKPSWFGWLAARA